MTDFIKEGIQQGDILYSLRYGEVKVSWIAEGNTYPIVGIILHGEGGDNMWTHDGKLLATADIPDLYWSKPEIIAPPRPKREVVKELDVFVNYDPRQPYQTESFCSEARADYHCSESDIRVKGKLIFTTTE